MTWPLATGNSWTYNVDASLLSEGQSSTYTYSRSDTVIGQSYFRGRPYQVLLTGEPAARRHLLLDQGGSVLLSLSPEDTLEAQGERTALVSTLPWPLFDLNTEGGDSVEFFAFDTSGVRFHYSATYYGLETLELGGCELQAAHLRYRATREIPGYSARFLTVDYYVRDEVGLVKEVGVDDVRIPGGLSHVKGWDATLASYRISTNP